jgi:hypothetical protein
MGRQVVRAIGSSPERALQPDLRHAAVGHRQRRDQRSTSPMAYFAPDPQLLAALKAPRRAAWTCN